MATDIDVDKGDTDPPSASTTTQPEPMDHEAHDDGKNQHEMVFRAEYSIMNGNAETFAAKRNVRSLVEAIITSSNADVTFMSKDKTLSFKLLKDFPNEAGAFGRFFPLTVLDSTHGEKRKAVVAIHLASPNAIVFHKPLPTTLQQYLDEHKIWLIEHKFDTLKVVKIGMVKGCSTLFSWQHKLQNKIQEQIDEANLADMTDDSPDNTIDTLQLEKTPAFELRGRNVKSWQKGSNEHKKVILETRAYEISCEAIHAERLRALLRDSQPDDKNRGGAFVDYALKKKDMQLFNDQIRAQNEFLLSLKKVVVSGIHRDAMSATTSDPNGLTMEEQLMNLYKTTTAEDGSESQTPMILSVEPTNYTDADGKWYLMCTAENEHEVEEFVDEKIPILYKTSDKYTEVQNAFKQFPKPHRGGANRAGFENYASALRNSTSPASQNPKHNGGSHRNRNYRKPKELRIVFEEAYPPLNKPKNKHKSVQSPDKSDTYPTRTAGTTNKNDNNAKRTAATSANTYYSTTSPPSKTSKTSKTRSPLTGGDNGKTAPTEKHSTDDMANILKRLAANEETIAKQSETIAKMQADNAQQYKTLTATLADTATQTKESTAKTQELIAQLTAQLSAFVTSSNGDTNSGNGVLHSTTRTVNSKRGAVASPSSSQLRTHTRLRRQRLVRLSSPKALDSSFATNENAHEEDQNMNDDSGRDSPNHSTTTTMEGSEAGAIHTQPGSQGS
jgi:hypothetical protein